MEWRSIAEFPDYQVSEDGRVRRARDLRELKGSIHKQGYRVFYLTIAGNYYGRLAHRLVALAFVPNPENKPNVCHNDGKPLSNHFSNLRWDNQTGNLADTLAHGTMQHGEKCKTHKFTEEEVRYIRNFYEMNKYRGILTDLAKEFDCPISRISDIVYKRTWKHLK